MFFFPYTPLQKDKNIEFDIKFKKSVAYEFES